MATSVEDAVVEIAEALETLAPQLEGLRDFERLNLHEDARAEIVTSIGQYVRREQLLIAAQGALTMLVEDHYPVLDVREIVQTAYADLVANKTTIDAALAQFAPDKATSLTTTAGPAELKS